ncbi:MAG TPA: nickel pincer cofactor biosynthesis protein LarC [Syntrophales bacterium]|nr:nickel pincer cofactor biosynthesis protein LarC [Syntrophales bacterium]
MTPEGEGILYFDCFSGISGDMAVAALLDLGIDEEALRGDLKGLPIGAYELKIAPTKRGGIRCREFRVVVTDQGRQRRRLGLIREIIEKSGLDKAVISLASSIFTLLAEAEAKVHGIDLEEVHFHEIGAVDSIVDIVAFSWAFARLNPSRVVSSPVNLGRGLVRCDHGTLPVPAPAVAELARGVPCYATDEPQRELTTPTGMAILKAVCREFGPLPPLTPLATGHGAGRADDGWPNFLRVVHGRPVEDGSRDEEITILETNIDDMNPQFWGHLWDRLLAAGALDCYLTPVMMKKNRPGQLLTVLCREGDRRVVEDVIFGETTTLGVRRSTARRRVLAREVRTVETPYGPIRVKAALQGGRVVKWSPEYEDCLSAAARSGRPLREIHAEVQRRAAGLFAPEDP